jgi:cell wall-associated NlpC family hydrolase
MFAMPQRLIQQTALLAAILRSIFSNTVAGLITAVLLGYWMPMERMAEAPPEQARESARVNIDPVSGKLLDRIEGAAAAAVASPSLSPILTQYGFILASAEESAATAPVKPKTAPQKPARTAPTKTNEAVQKTAPATVSVGPELADAPPAPSAEDSESWISRFSPARLTARVASGVASKAVGAGRAVADRLGGLL